MPSQEEKMKLTFVVLFTVSCLLFVGLPPMIASAILTIHYLPATNAPVWMYYLYWASFVWSVLAFFVSTIIQAISKS